VAVLWVLRGGGGAIGVGRHGRIMSGFVDPEAYYDPREFLDTLDRRGGITVECEESGIPAQPREPTRA
jgi:hypothetical protein